MVSLGRKPGYIIGLDSATAVLQATAKCLQGQEFAAGGFAPSLLGSLINAASYLPRPLVQKTATFAGWLDASSPRVVKQIRSETMARWVVKQYPQQRYPGVLIGSSNGAATHLSAALGMPFLPQTLLVCLRHSNDIDDPRAQLKWANAKAQQLLSQNPDLWVYQLHDPNQDRLKVGHVTYFRLKRSRLGEQYKRFLKENLVPGGTIFLVDCQYQWLESHLGDRHVFQFGGKGGLEPEDYFRDSQELTDFLQRQGSKYHTWHPPEPDGYWPESEWGFEPSLRADVMEFAREHGLRVCRIVFNDPQDLSPLVADLYRWWYQVRGLPSDRLLVESFTYLHPWWALRLGLIPYWAVFNDQTSLDHLNQYLDTAPPYDEIYANLFSNGLESLGMASIDQWQSMLGRAIKQGSFVGVNPDTYPADNASFIRHYTDLKKLEGRYPMPEAMTLQQLNAFLTQAGDRYAVQWLEAEASSPLRDFD